jgi:hypothetical protein
MTDHRYPRAQDADMKRMADAAARRAGVEVHWVDYPSKTQP